MANVIKPEQIHSSMTPVAGEIPVINVSSELVLPGKVQLTYMNSVIKDDTTRFGQNGIRIQPTSINTQAALTLMPSGTSTISTFRLYNKSSDINVGAVSMTLNNTIFNIITESWGSGNIPTAFQWNGNTIWHSANDGLGSGLDADFIRGYQVTQHLRSIDSPTFSSLILSISTGTSPLTIDSTTKVTNLNADLVDSAHASQTATAGQIPILNSTTGSLVLPAGGVGGNAKLLLGRNSSTNNYGTISTENIGTYSGLKFEVRYSGAAYIAMTIAPDGTLYSGTTNLIWHAGITNVGSYIAGNASGQIPLNNGTLCSTLNADKLDGYHAGNASGQIPLNNGTLCSTLNADLLDGKNTGNSAGNIPLNNSTLCSTLNADLLDGYHAGNASGQIPLNNGTLCSTLNADLLDGYHAGNASGQIPLNNGTLNTNLNAQYINSISAGNLSGNIPISNGTLNTNLNTDKLDGSHAVDIISASSPPGTVAMYAGVTAPSGWLLCDGSAVSRSQYSALHTVLKDADGLGVYGWGDGDGSTTFNLPDFRGIYPKGAGTTNRTLGKDAAGNYYAGYLSWYRQDKFQGHKHDQSPIKLPAGANIYAFGSNSFTTDDVTGTGLPVTDGAHGIPRTDVSTEPQSVGINFIIKY